MNLERILLVLEKPHTSEKSTTVADKYKHIVFKVLRTATKIEIKQAVENIFNVKVKAVNTVNVAGKTKRFKQSMGKRKDWKKAYVALHNDYDIDFTAIEQGK